MSRQTTVLVVDDHPVVLAGLVALISTDPAMEVVGSASGVAGALALALEEPPSVCILDLQLPDGDGVSLGVELKARWPSARVLILTMSDDPAAVIRTLSAGLDGYVLKDSDPAELVSAVRAAAEGVVVLGRGASRPVIAAASALPESNPIARLDARDREILDLLVRGLSTAQIANELFFAPKTIRNRLTQILGKLGVDTREEAVALGIASGLGT